MSNVLSLHFGSGNYRAMASLKTIAVASRQSKAIDSIFDSAANGQINSKSPLVALFNLDRFGR